MTRVAVALALAAASAAALGAWFLWRPPPRLSRVNYAGRPVPAVLGLAVVPAVALSAIAAASVLARPGPDTAVRGDVLMAGAVGLWIVGYLDDAVGGGARGFGAHLRSLARGRLTTGIVKLVAGIAAAAVVAILLGGSPVRIVASTLLIAVATNVWNALDVAPGRALKWAIVGLVPLLAVTWRDDYGLIAAAALGASVGALPFDLRERGMLGDAGSNPLGFLVGVGLAAVLPTAGVVVAAAIGLAGQVVAETITISRVLEAAPPLRWFDRLGRRSV